MWLLEFIENMLCFWEVLSLDQGFYGSGHGREEQLTLKPEGCRETSKYLDTFSINRS